MNSKKLAAIFDMDGVLIDSVERNWKINNLVLAEFGINISDEELSKYVGRPLEDQILAINNEHGASVDYLDFSQKVAVLKDKNEIIVKPIKGARSLIKKLYDNGILIALGTSNNFKTAKSVLHNLGVADYFAAIVTSEDVTSHKPSPEVYQKCSSLVNVKPENCVVFEDAFSGILAAKNANMACIALNNKYCLTEHLAKADAVVESLEDKQIEIFFREKYNIVF